MFLLQKHKVAGEIPVSSAKSLHNTWEERQILVAQSSPNRALRPSHRASAKLQGETCTELSSVKCTWRKLEIN